MERIRTRSPPSLSRCFAAAHRGGSISPLALHKDDHGSLFASTVRSLAIVSASPLSAWPRASRTDRPVRRASRIVAPSMRAPALCSTATCIRSPMPPMTAASRLTPCRSLRMHLVLRRSSSQEAALNSSSPTCTHPAARAITSGSPPISSRPAVRSSDQDVATVESWLCANGFEVAGVEPGKQVIEFTGSVAQLRNAFHAQIHKYRSTAASTTPQPTTRTFPRRSPRSSGGFVILNNFHLKSHARGCWVRQLRSENRHRQTSMDGQRRRRLSHQSAASTSRSPPVTSASSTICPTRL